MADPRFAVAGHVITTAMRRNRRAIAVNRPIATQSIAQNRVR